SQLQGDPQPPGAAPQPECTAPNPAKPSLRQVLRSTVLIGVAVTGLVTLMRWGGLLEALELSTYDTLVRLSPAEAQDERLLLITVDDQDIEYQAANGMALQGTLSDQALRLLIEALQPLEPQSIGLDVYRPGGLNLPASAADLAIFAICKAPAAEGGDPTGVAPPPDWPISQIGFSDFVTDRDGVLRRHLLAIQNLSPASRCTASNALSLLLALYYLQEAGVAYELTPEREFRFGDVLLRRLTPHAGGYRNVDAAGYQLMLRYRGQRPQDIAAAIPLRQLLSGELSPALIEQLQGRIVLVGSTALTSADAWTAPQSWGKPEVERRVPGVVMQAQMVSQVLSAVLDQRPLLWWWPEWIEVLWIGLWAMVGAGLAHLRRGVWLVPVELGAIAVSCYGILGLGGWVPLVPPVMALAAAAALTRRIVRRRASALPE
ncbi:MAG: CHASE2 domain-containing protein, partial [Cyanobacteria bacterium P01_A01_bin.135]